jgi:hypothetical protein
LLQKAGFRAEKFEWSVNFKGKSAISIQLSTEEFYRDFPSRAVPADVHGILMRVASLEDTLRGKIKAWSESGQRQSETSRDNPPLARSSLCGTLRSQSGAKEGKRIKDLADIARLIEVHPHLRKMLPEDLKRQTHS